MTIELTAADQQELNLFIAEKVMGWKRFVYQMPDCFPSMIPPGEAQHVSNLQNPPDYTTDHAAAWAMEERIKGMGLQQQYANELVAVCCGHSGEQWTWPWITAHATPLERCLAAKRAVERSKQ